MNALDAIREPISKSTLDHYFKHGLTGDIYRGPFHVLSDSDNKYRLGIQNYTTLQWEFLNLDDLRHLERITKEEFEEYKASIMASLTKKEPAAK